MHNKATRMGNKIDTCIRCICFAMMPFSWRSQAIRMPPQWVWDSLPCIWAGEGGSHSTESLPSFSQVNYYVKHLVQDSEGYFNSALGWIVEGRGSSQPKEWQARDLRWMKPCDGSAFLSHSFWIALFRVGKSDVLLMRLDTSIVSSAMRTGALEGNQCCRILASLLARCSTLKPV